MKQNINGLKLAERYKELSSKNSSIEQALKSLLGEFGLGINSVQEMTQKELTTLSSQIDSGKMLPAYQALEKLRNDLEEYSIFFLPEGEDFDEGISETNKAEILRRCTNPAVDLSTLKVGDKISWNFPGQKSLAKYTPGMLLPDTFERIISGGELYILKKSPHSFHEGRQEYFKNGNTKIENRLKCGQGYQTEFEIVSNDYELPKKSLLSRVAEGAKYVSGELFGIGGAAAMTIAPTTYSQLNNGRSGEISNIIDDFDRQNYNGSGVVSSIPDSGVIRFYNKNSSTFEEDKPLGRYLSSSINSVRDSEGKQYNRTNGGRFRSSDGSELKPSQDLVLYPVNEKPTLYQELALLSSSQLKEYFLTRTPGQVFDCRAKIGPKSLLRLMKQSGLYNEQLTKAEIESLIITELGVSGELFGLLKTQTEEKQIISSIIRTESDGRPFNISPTGAIGLCQIVGETYLRSQVNPFDVKSSIKLAADHLRQSYRRFNSVDLAILAYNRGDGYVESYGKNGRLGDSEANTYVGKVYKSHRDMYGITLNGSGVA